MTDTPHSHAGYDPDVTAIFAPDDDIAEAFRANSLVEAEVIASELRDRGIPAAVYGEATAGMLGTIDHLEGTRVMVRRADLDVAAAHTQEVVDREHEPVSPADDAALAQLAEEAVEPDGWVDPETGAAV